MRVFLALVALSLLQCRSPKSSAMQVPDFDKQGHRGCRGLMPENTIPAMLKAVDLGVTTLEMDAVITADGEVVLSHEPWMSWLISTTPDGKTFTSKEERDYKIYGMTYAELQRWDVGLKPHPWFRNQEKIAVRKPKLADVIDAVEAYARQKGVAPLYYNIETKSNVAGDDIFHPKPEPFTDQLMAVVSRKGIAGRTIIQSFDPRTLQVMHRKYPQVRTALLVEGFSKTSMEENLRELGFTPSIYSPEFNLVTPELVKACRQKGMRLIPWTVNDAANITRLKAMGVDGIISDYPNLFQP